jgi:phosphatidylserine/phosphatidylglycerophosphate/cardiolipin synthase-like enzyme
LQDLLQTITELVANTPPDRIRQLAGKIRSLSEPAEATKLTDWALTSAVRPRVEALFNAWADSGIPATELAGMLIGASHAYHEAKNAQVAELVWTGPSSQLVATRKTEQALLQVIQVAESKLFLTSFVAYKLTSVMDALAYATARGVVISMLLESSDQHGGGVSVDAIGHMKRALPTARIYFWGDRPEKFAGGKVHAKVAVADERVCFISSANLTGHAMEKNMEAGILISGGSIPRNLHRHLEALDTTRVITRV